MKKMLMYLFGGLDTDARVRRTISALDKDFKIDLICDKSGEFRNTNLIFYKSTGNTVVDILNSIRLFKKQLNNNQYDVVYGNDFYSLFVLCYVINNKKYNKVITVYDAHELSVDNKTKIISKQRLISALERFVVNRATLCIAADYERIKIMKRVYQTDRYIHEYRNISSLPKNNSRNDICIQLDSSSDLKVIYAGALTSSRGLDKLIYELKGRSDIQLIIVGDGPYKDKAEQLVEQTSIKCIFVGKVKYADLYTYISRCDIGYVFYENNNLNNIYSASNKVYEYISAGVAIVANDNMNLRKTVEKLDVGVADNDVGSALSKVIKHVDKYKANARSVDIPGMELKEINSLRDYITMGIVTKND